MKKVIGFIFAAALVMILAIAYYGLKNLDAIVKHVIVQVGTNVTGSQVAVDSVSISLKEGRGEISGLNLANPTGFDSKHLFHLNQVALDIKPNSLFGDVIVIDEVLIDGADIIAEQKGQQTNLQVLLKQLEQNGGGSQSESAPVEEKPADPNAKPVRLAITKFSFINNKAELHTEKWAPQVLSVPNIVMNNLGSADNGLTPEQLSSEVVKRLVRSVEKAATDALKKKAQEEAKKAITNELDKNLSQDTKDKLQKLKDAANN